MSNRGVPDLVPVEDEDTDEYDPDCQNTSLNPSAPRSLA